MKYPGNMRLEEYFKQTHPNQQTDIEFSKHCIGGDYKVVLMNYGEDGYLAYVTANDAILGSWMLSTVGEYYQFKRWTDAVFTHTKCHIVFAVSDGINHYSLLPAGLENATFKFGGLYPPIKEKIDDDEVIICYTGQVHRYTTKSCVESISVNPLCTASTDVMKALIYYEWYKVSENYQEANQHYKPRILGHYLCHSDECKPPYVVMEEIYPDFTNLYKECQRNFKWPENANLDHVFQLIYNRGAIGRSLYGNSLMRIGADAIEAIRFAITSKPKEVIT